MVAWRCFMAVAFCLVFVFVGQSGNVIDAQTLRICTNFSLICTYKQASSDLSVTITGQRFSLGARAFEDGSSELTKIELKDNTIESVHARAFEGIPRLIHLVISGTKTNVFEVLQSQMFQPISTFLVSLSLSNNNISNVGITLSVFTSSLTSLDLSSNQLTYLSNTSFSTLNRLSILHLEDNRLSGLPPTVFGAQTSLGYLYIDGNRIQYLDTGLLSATTYLRTLSARGNGLTGIGENLFHMKINNSLLFLDLSENNLTSIKFDVWAESRLNSLQALMLQQNLITAVTNTSMINIGGSNMKLLQLRYCRITEIAANSFERMTALEGLYLEGNDLKQIYPGTFNSLSKVTVLGLSDNNLDELPSAIFDNMTSLIYFFAEQNSLTVIPDRLFERSSDLSVIRLRFNYLSEIPPFLVKNSSNVEEISLRGNLLRVLPPKLFLRTPKLKELTVDQNLLRCLPPTIPKKAFVDGIDADGMYRTEEGSILTVDVETSKRLPNCQYCSPGMFNPFFQGLLPCFDCSRGRFAPESGAGTCDQCPSGRYQTERGRSTCNQCDSAALCSGKGLCLPDGGCNCTMPFGGDRCDSCHPSRFGINCANSCNCSLNSICDNGLSGTGRCICNAHWSGPTCTVCEVGSNHYTNSCIPCDSCGPFGKCRDGQNGNGTCLCDRYWTGSKCENCQVGSGFYGPTCMRCPSCGHNGYCDDGPTGSGKCVCTNNFLGRFCSYPPICPFDTKPFVASQLNPDGSMLLVQVLGGRPSILTTSVPGAVGPSCELSQVFNETVIDAFGQGAKCTWSQIWRSNYIAARSDLPWWYCHEFRASVSLGTGALVTPGDNIAPLADTMQWIRPELTYLVNDSRILPPPWAVVPQVVISSETELRSTCRPLTLDASATTNLGGRPAKFKWRVTTPRGQYGSLVSFLEFVESPRATIPVHLFNLTDEAGLRIPGALAETLFNFSVSATNYLGQTSQTVYRTVLVKPESDVIPTPVVRLYDVIDHKREEPLSIAASVELRSSYKACKANEASYEEHLLSFLQTGTLKYRWSVKSLPDMNAVDLRGFNVSSRMVNIPAFSLKPDTHYQLQLTVSWEPIPVNPNSNAIEFPNTWDPSKLVATAYSTVTTKRSPIVIAFPDGNDRVLRSSVQSISLDPSCWLKDLDDPNRSDRACLSLPNQKYNISWACEKVPLNQSFTKFNSSRSESGASPVGIQEVKSQETLLRSSCPSYIEAITNSSESALSFQENLFPPGYDYFFTITVKDRVDGRMTVATRVIRIVQADILLEVDIVLDPCTVTDATKRCTLPVDKGILANAFIRPINLSSTRAHDKSAFDLFTNYKLEYSWGFRVDGSLVSLDAPLATSNISTAMSFKFNQSVLISGAALAQHNANNVSIVALVRAVHPREHDVVGAVGSSEKPVLLNLPPRLGSCRLREPVDGLDGIGFLTAFVIQCQNWVDDNLPLKYALYTVPASVINSSAEAQLLRDAESDDPRIPAKFDAFISLYSAANYSLVSSPDESTRIQTVIPSGYWFLIVSVIDSSNAERRTMVRVTPSSSDIMDQTVYTSPPTLNSLQINFEATNTDNVPLLLESMVQIARSEAKPGEDLSYLLRYLSSVVATTVNSPAEAEQGLKTMVRIVEIIHKSVQRGSPLPAIVTENALDVIVGVLSQLKSSESSGLQNGAQTVESLLAPSLAVLLEKSQKNIELCEKLVQINSLLTGFVSLSRSKTDGYQLDQSNILGSKSAITAPPISMQEKTFSLSSQRTAARGSSDRSPQDGFGSVSSIDGPQVQMTPDVLDLAELQNISSTGQIDLVLIQFGDALQQCYGKDLLPLPVYSTNGSSSADLVSSPVEVCIVNVANGECIDVDEFPNDGSFMIVMQPDQDSLEGSIHEFEQIGRELDHDQRIKEREFFDVVNQYLLNVGCPVGTVPMTINWTGSFYEDITFSDDEEIELAKQLDNINQTVIYVCKGLANSLESDGMYGNSTVCDLSGYANATNESLVFRRPVYLRELVCSWLDVSTGQWSNTGCSMVSMSDDNASVTCECTHLSEFSLILHQSTEYESTIPPELIAAFAQRNDTNGTIPSLLGRGIKCRAKVSFMSYRVFSAAYAIVALATMKILHFIYLPLFASKQKVKSTISGSVGGKSGSDDSSQGSPKKVAFIVQLTICVYTLMRMSLCIMFGVTADTAEALSTVPTWLTALRIQWSAITYAVLMSLYVFMVLTWNELCQKVSKVANPRLVPLLERGRKIIVVSGTFLCIVILLGAIPIAAVPSTLKTGLKIATPLIVTCAGLISIIVPWQAMQVYAIVAAKPENGVSTFSNKDVVTRIIRLRRLALQMGSCIFTMTVLLIWSIASPLTYFAYFDATNSIYLVCDILSLISILVLYNPRQPKKSDEKSTHKSGVSTHATTAPTAGK